MNTFTNNNAEINIIRKLIKECPELYLSALTIMRNSGIYIKELKETDVVAIKEVFNDHLLFSLVVFYNNKYYCFNYHPKRKDVALSHTLTSCDMNKQCYETIESLKRLYS